MTAVHKPVETLLVDRVAIACDGDGGALGHPRIYLNIAAAGRVECPYCGRNYVLKEGAKSYGGH